MLRSTVERSLGCARLVLFVSPSLAWGCRAEHGPDVPATVAPYFPVHSNEQVAASLDGGAPAQDEERAEAHDAAGPSDGAAPAASDLPCEVANLLRARCFRCHGSPALPGVPMSLVSYADLIAPAKLQPGASNAQRALLRVQMNTMPPGGGLSGEEVDVLARWVAAGTKPDRCDTGGAPATSPDPGASTPDATLKDAGTTDAGTRDAQSAQASDAASTPPMLDASAQDAGADGGPSNDASTADASSPLMCSGPGRWTLGDAGSALMSPGTPCLGCHGAHAPIFTFAGSIYATAHEPDQCNGVAANDAEVVIKAANGYKLALSINAAGNFFTQTTLPKPYTVEVRYQGRVRAKQTAQTSGDCNACHGELGANGASGRILLP